MMTANSTQGPPLLELHNVRVTYGDSCVLHVPALRIEPGTGYILAGPNGSGKSSLLCGLAGIGPTLEGNVRYLAGKLTGICVTHAHEMACVSFRRGGEFSRD